MNNILKNLIYDRNALPTRETIINSSLISRNYNFESYFLQTSKRKYFLKINKKKDDQCLVINRMYNDTQFSSLTKREIYYYDQKIILMEYFEAERLEKQIFNQHIFGEEIAKFHTKRKSQFGFQYDTYIGSLLQENKMSKSWKEFFLHQRFDYLFCKIKKDMSIYPELVDKILAVRGYIERNLDDPSESTLIHGDIWSGNTLIKTDGSIQIIDTVLFYADNEYELAYIYLNGTFGRGFYDSYNHIHQICDDFWQFKLYIYQIIPLMQYALLDGPIYIKEIEKICNFLIKRENLKY